MTPKPIPRFSASSAANQSKPQKTQNIAESSQERRTALISAAVTGKVDVRNWRAPVSSNAEQRTFS